MIERLHKSLIIEGNYYSESQLINHVEKKLSELHQNNWEARIFMFIAEWISDNPTVEVKTSGSTGSPKWIKIDKEKMIRSAQLTGDFLDLSKTDKALLCLPIDFIAGKMMVVRAFVLGLNLIYIKPSGNPLEATNISIDFAAMTPMQVHNVLENSGGENELNNIRKLIIGGAEIHGLLLDKIRKLKNLSYHTYGMTETMSHIALKKLNGSNTSVHFKALKDIYFTHDERGCLVITARHLAENEIITNDVVEIKNNREFEFIGRFDNIINSGGIKISPEQLEQKLEPFIMQRFIIVGLPDEKLGQKLAIVIEDNAQSEPDFDTFFKNAGLQKYMIPKIFFWLKHFPETENGKIIRSKIVSLILK